MAIPVAVVGLGNVGKAVVEILAAKTIFPDIVLRAVVTRRPDRVSASGIVPDHIPIYFFGDKRTVPLYHVDDENAWQELPVKVVILCGGSATDLPLHGPKFLKHFYIVDSYDRHGQIDDWQDPASQMWRKGYFRSINDLAKKYGMIAIPCFGWDPGMFSAMRTYFSALSGGAPVFSFYGCEEVGGRSMGHTQALRAIPGVKKAVQYTHANHEMLLRVRAGELTDQPLPTEMVMLRECFVVLEPWADEVCIKSQIQSMPDYFVGYNTEIYFISEKDFDAKHQSMRHDGTVLCNGPHGLMEYRNVFPSNPHATACALIAAARATVNLERAGFRPGAYTPNCIAPKYFLKNPEDHLGFI